MDNSMAASDSPSGTGRVLWGGDNGRFPAVNAKNNGGRLTQAAFSVRATETAGNADSIFPDAITIGVEN